MIDCTALWVTLHKDKGVRERKKLNIYKKRDLSQSDMALDFDSMEIPG